MSSNTATSTSPRYPYEVRQNTGMLGADGPVVGRLISRHESLRRAGQSWARYVGLHNAPVVWRRTDEGELVRLTEAEADQMRCR